MTDRRRGATFACVSLALALLTFAVFWPVRDAGFIHFDDDENIARNFRVGSGLTAAGAAWALRTTQTGNWQPLTWLSLMLDVHLFGVDPARMHQVNILLHAANGALLFGLLRALTGGLWSSALAAALFLAHPLHVESVAWISERKDVLSTLFWLLGLVAYGRYARRPGLPRLLPVAILMAASLMAKPMAVTFPLTLLLLDYWPLGRLRAGAVGRLILEKAPLFALAAAAAALAIFAQDRGAALNSLQAFPLPVRIGNAVLSYEWYLGKAVWPTRLAFFYPHPGSGLSWAHAALAAALLAALSAAAVRLRRLPYLATGWFWHLVTLVPVIGIVQVGGQARADRYSYVPLTGLLLIASWGVRDLTRRRRGLRIAGAAAAVSCVAALAAAARVQAGHWRDSRSLSSHAARVAPSWIAFLDLGITAELEGASAEALDHIRRSRDLDPGNTLVWYNLGWIQERRREWAEALESYRRAAVLGPQDPAPPTALGVLLMALGRHDEAVPWLEKAARLAPDSARAHGKLGAALVRGGERRRGEAHLAAAVRLHPGDSDARLELARLLLAQGRRAEALAHLNAVLQADPGRREARELLGR